MQRVRERVARLGKRRRKINGRRAALRGGVAMFAVLMLMQFFYPAQTIPPFARIDGLAVGGMNQDAAVKKVNDAYRNEKLSIYLGDDKEAFTAPTLMAADISVDNRARIKALGYPWYLRIIPTSLLWAGLKQTPTPAPKYGAKFDAYVEKTLMPECRKAPTDATLRADGGNLVVVGAIPGGQCDKDAVLAVLRKTPIKLDKPTQARIALKEIAPAIGDSVARAKADELNARLAQGIMLRVNTETVTIPAGEVASWLDFAGKDGGIDVVVNYERSHGWLEKNIAGKVAVKSGISYITTKDFTEISRTNGASGQALNLQQTLDAIQAVVVGAEHEAHVVTQMIPPEEQYTRTYSGTDAGLSALLANYAKDHPGTWGITLIELDGKKRRASYNGSKSFVTASTYKLFVAYSLLKRIDAGTESWDANATCFNKMITYSDNACAEMFLDKLGLTTVTKEIQAIGLRDSNFTKSGGPFTTSDDLALLLGMIQSGQNFSPANRERLISAMIANVYRKGIPAGASGTVADKVGFMGRLLHDAAIVYGPNGTYVLVAMTEGSSWAQIADLAKQIDTLRAQ